MREQEILKKYISYLTSMAEASKAGNYRKSNRQHDIMKSYYEQLKGMGHENVLKLRGYLQTEDDQIKCWLATHLLTDLSKKPGGLSAEMVLEEWRSGWLKP